MNHYPPKLDHIRFTLHTRTPRRPRWLPAVWMLLIGCSLILISCHHNGSGTGLQSSPSDPVMSAIDQPTDVSGDQEPRASLYEELGTLQRMLTYWNQQLSEQQVKLDQLRQLGDTARQETLHAYIAALNKTQTIEKRILALENSQDDTAHSEDSQEISMETALRDIDNHRYPIAMQWLKTTIESSDPMQRCTARLLLARAMSDRLNWSDAVQLYLDTGEDPECLCRSHSLHLAADIKANIAEETLDASPGLVSEVISLYKEILFNDREYPFREQVMRSMMELMAQKEFWEQMLRILESLEETEETLYRKSQALYQLDRWTEAEPFLRKYWIDYPGGIHAADVEKRYRTVLTQLKKPFPDISIEETFKRAKTLDKNGIRDQAGAAFTELLQEKISPEMEAECRLQRAKILHDTRRNEAALTEYETFLKRFPKHGAVATALIRMGTLYRRMDRDADYLRVTGQIVANHTKSSQWPDAVIGRGEYYRGLKKYDQAARDFDLLAKRTDENGAIGRWKRAWIDYDRKRYNAAITQFESLAAREKGTGWEPQCQYWIGRCLELMGKTEEAQKKYESILSNYPWDYPALLAEKHMAAQNRLRLWEPGAIPELSDEQRTIPQVQKALILTQAGYYHRASVEWDKALTLDKSNQSIAYETARCRYEAGDISGARSLLTRAFWKERRNGTFAREVAEMLYPFPASIKPLILEAADSASVDPSLLISVILQESGFDPASLSYNLAAGYMQLMPELFDRITQQWEEAPPSIARFEPKTNLRVGASYLRLLLDRYDGSIPQALAGYNAGEQRVDQWQNQFPNLNDEEWVEHIPFQQTRLFVKNILENYRCVRIVYGDDVSPKAAGRDN